MRCLFPLLLLAACAPAEPPLLIDDSRKVETVADDKPVQTPERRP